MPIAVVTDSTAYLPEEYARRFAVRTVPLHVNVAGAEALEQDFSPGALTAAWASKHRVTTAGADSAALAREYRAALADGADGVVSVHLSRSLSSTWDAARFAAAEVDLRRVRVVDSRSTAMGLGFAVLAAAQAARSGADLSAVESIASVLAARATMVFSVQTLEHLRRGGRIGTAAAVLGTALSIKPLLQVRDGRIGVLEKARTTARAMTRLVEISARAAGERPAAVAVHHLAAPRNAAQLAERIQQRLSRCEDCVVSEVGAVVGAHVGPGALGVVVLPGGWRDSLS